MRRLMLSAALPGALLFLWSCQSAPPADEMAMDEPPPQQEQPAAQQQQPAQQQQQPAQQQDQQVAAAQPAARPGPPAARAPGPQPPPDLHLVDASLTVNGRAVPVPAAFQQRFVLQVRADNMIRLNVFNAANGALISSLDGRVRLAGDMVFVQVTRGSLPPAVVEWAGPVVQNLPSNELAFRAESRNPLILVANLSAGSDNYQARLTFRP